MSTPLISCNNLTFGYSETKAVLNDVSFSVYGGEFITIIGCNGAGKSTLLKLIALREKSTPGTIDVIGKPVHEYREKELATVVGYLEQFPHLSSLTISEYVLMGALPLFGKNRFWFKKSEKQAMLHLLEDTGLFELKDCSIAEVSGGERQVAQICRALMAEPKLLLLDEPVSHLDIHHAEMVIRLLKKIQKKHGVTIVTTLHDLNLAYACSDKVFLLDNGGVLSQLTCDVTEDLTTLKSTFNARFESLKSEKNDRNILVPLWDFL